MTFAAPWTQGPCVTCGHSVVTHSGHVGTCLWKTPDTRCDCGEYVPPSRRRRSDEREHMLPRVLRASG